jgi:hypothetical protein
VAIRPGCGTGSLGWFAAKQSGDRLGGFSDTQIHVGVTAFVQKRQLSVQSGHDHIQHQQSKGIAFGRG